MDFELKGKKKLFNEHLRILLIQFINTTIFDQYKIDFLNGK